MDETIRKVAWTIAETWWRKRNRVAAGSVPEANSSAEYADNFWQSWCEEAKAAVGCMEALSEQRAVIASGGGVSAAVARI
jgi:hypothetical protein